MRLAVIADIHANLPALQAVLEDLEAYHPDAVLAAGDLVLGGPQPVEVLQALRALPLVCIRGNNEEYLLEYGRAPEKYNGKRWAPLHWTYARLGASDLEWIANLPRTLSFAPDGATALRMVHGSPPGCPQGGLVPDDARVLELFRRAHLVPPDNAPTPLSDALAVVSEPNLICAHTHIPWQQRIDGRLVFNPGSVGAPINEERAACYARLEWREGALLEWSEENWQVELRAVEYNYRVLLDSYTHDGYLPLGGAFARACLLNALTGLNYAWFFVQHAASLAQRAGLPPDTLPDDLWDEAERTFDWLDVETLV
jgi:predicted phosphodiesterase